MAARSPRRSTRLTRKASSIATSSPPTSCCRVSRKGQPRARSRCSTSVSPRRPARLAQHDSTCRRRRRDAMTDQGVILGTAAYMSPEQAKGHTADTRSECGRSAAWSTKCSPGDGPLTRRHVSHAGERAEGRTGLAGVAGGREAARERAETIARKGSSGAAAGHGDVKLLMSDAEWDGAAVEPSPHGVPGGSSAPRCLASRRVSCPPRPWSPGGGLCREPNSSCFGRRRWPLRPTHPAGTSRFLPTARTWCIPPVRRPSHWSCRPSAGWRGQSRATAAGVPFFGRRPADLLRDAQRAETRVSRRRLEFQGL